MVGCTNPNAVNYNPAATSEDYSCLYLFKHNGTCHLFKDFLPLATDDKSFTLSYSLLSNAWVFFHDYIPDFYIHVRDSLYALKDNTILKFNEGNPGLFFDRLNPKPFFIDIIFAADGDMLLESVQWVSEYLADTEHAFNTLTHIAIWNSTQHTGRIALDQIFKNLQYDKMRRTKGAWNFDKIRDIIKTEDMQFLGNVFSDYALDITQTADLPWYRAKLLQDKWFCVRFEFDNRSAAQLVLHDTTATAQKTTR